MKPDTKKAAKASTRQTPTRYKGAKSGIDGKLYIHMGLPEDIYNKLEDIRVKRGFDSVQALMRFLAAQCANES